MTKLKLIFSQWIQIAGLMLIIGALAWTIKLIIIISTDGRIIDTGAAAFFMKVGLLMLIPGSTGIGLRLTVKRNIFLRVIAIILSPALMFGSFILFSAITNPLFNGSSIPYAQEEAPIGLAVIVYLIVGYILVNSKKTILIPGQPDSQTAR
jgi:hypothetical protein